MFVRDFPAKGAKFQVSTAGGSEPRWRRDGRELFYLGVDGRLMLVDVETEPDFKLDTPKAMFQTPLMNLRAVLGETLRQQPIDGDGHRRHARRDLHGLAAPKRSCRRERSGDGLFVNQHTVADEIDDDVLRNAGCCVGGQLRTEIERERAVRNLDHAQHIARARWMLQVIIDAPANDGAVRLRFVQGRKRDGLLGLQEAAERLELRRIPGQSKHRDSMPVPDGHRVFPGCRAILPDNEAIDQFE
jgi:hypothetical protein